MVDIQGLTLILTHSCNIRCRHCGFSSGPDMTLTMEEQKAKSYILEALKFKSVKMIIFTGGEPMLRFELLNNLMTFSHEKGLVSELVSNSFWANDYKEAYKIFKGMKDIGLKNYVTSMDDFHAEFIPQESVQNAVFAALDNGIKVVVKVTETPHSKITLKSVHEIFGKLLNNSFFHCTVSPLVRSGRYSGSYGGNNFFEDEHLQRRCQNVMKFPTVSPDGSIYPCCGFGDSARYLGNANERALSEILNEMSNNLLLNLLSSIGPMKVMKMANPKIFLSQLSEFTNICDICNSLYGPLCESYISEFLKSII